MKTKSPYKTAQAKRDAARRALFVRKIVYEQRLAVVSRLLRKRKLVAEVLAESRALRAGEAGGFGSNRARRLPVCAPR